MRGLLFNPHKGAKVIDFKDDLDTYYKLLDCDTIEPVCRKYDGEWFTVVCDEEGRLKGKTPSLIYKDGYIDFVGNLLFLGPLDGENWKNITDKQVETIKKSICLCEQWGKEFLAVVRDR